MRNAEKLDMEFLTYNNYSYIMKVMFLVEHPWFGTFKAHIKQAFVNVEEMQHPLLVETANGSLLIVERDWLHAVPRKQGTPANPKSPHVKGSKPYLANCVPYDSSLIKLGTKVKCRDGKIRTVVGIEDFKWKYQSPRPVVRLSTGQQVWLSNGKESTIHSCKTFYDIMKVIIDVPQQDKHNGYSVGEWHFWQGVTDVPPVDGNVMVKIWVRGRTHPQSLIDSATNFDWDSKVGLCSDIIAFRIVGDE